MFVDDQPLAPTPLPNGGVPTIHFQLATALLLDGEVERDASPSDVAVARQLQVIFRRQLQALEPAEQAPRAFIVFAPTCVLQRSDIIENKVSLLRVERRGVIGVE